MCELAKLRMEEVWVDPAPCRNERSSSVVQKVVYASRVLVAFPALRWPMAQFYFSALRAIPPVIVDSGNDKNTKIQF